ncbi:hypothetical protein WA026_022123 [Henosepilachna vigintioctopunctata]|uniref:Uncharacterized protein n=1 Tax=Henosepilachna vigintioctopunctata TaxID=420089 RepID=A0AAW1UCQ9_9CUCU
MRSTTKVFPLCSSFASSRWLASVFDPESYAGGSLATGRVTQAGQVGGETPDEEEHPGPPGWGLGVRLTTSPWKKNQFRNLKKLKPDRIYEDDLERMRT